MSNIQTIMTQDAAGQELVTFASQTAKRLVKDGLTRSQIRNIFTEVRKIEALWDTDAELAARRLTMLKPKLGYQSARQRHVKGLQDVLTPAIDLVIQANGEERTERFNRFVELFEAILAYHRVEGGRN